MWELLADWLKERLGSWRTTLVAAAGAVAVILTQVVNLLDDDPATLFNWEIFWGVGIAVLIGLFTRDHA